jgi:hypothetical protein
VTPLAVTSLLWLAFAAAQFSHKPHVETAKLKCLDCHTAPARFGAEVGYPAVTKCRLCHPQIAKDTMIPSARVFKLADFVYFDHRFHLVNGVVCEDCHGPDAARDSTKMSFCQPCHVKSHAAAGCGVCHEIR